MYSHLPWEKNPFPKLAFWTGQGPMAVVKGPDLLGEAEGWSPSPARPDVRIGQPSTSAQVSTASLIMTSSFSALLHPEACH